MPTHVTLGTNGFIDPTKLGSNTPASSNWLRGDGAWVTIPAGGPGGGVAASIDGNTAGVPALISAGTVVLAGGNNITLSQAGSAITVSGPSLTGYLTTAAQSDHTHSQYLTTAAQSNHSHNFATTTTNGASIVVGTANSAGATIGVPAFLTTAQAPGAYLTTARASNDAVGLNTALTANGVSWTVNSSGLSLNVPAFLTTAAQSGHSHNFATTTTNGASIVVGTANSAGATIGVPAFLTTAQAPGAYLTTARASNDAVGLNTALTANGVSWTVNSSGLSLNVPAFLTTAAQSGHSHNFATTTTNGTAIVVGTANSAGATIGVPAFLTTAQAPGAYLTTAAQSDHSHGNPTLALTNLSGTTASNSAGLTLSLSAAAPGGGGAINVSAGAASGNLQTVQFNDLNGVSFGLNGSTITASHNGLTTAAQSNHSHGNPTLALTNLTGTTASASNGLTISLSAAAPGGGAAQTIRWTHGPFVVSNNLITNVTALTQRPIFIPINIPGQLSADEMMWAMSRSTSGSNNFTLHIGVYTMANGTSMNLLYSSSASYSASVTASISGIRIVEFPLGSQMSSLTQGQYVLGAIFSATATASMNYSLMGHSTANPAVGGMHTGGNTFFTHTSHHILPMWGRYSTTTGALPSAVAANGVIGFPTGASAPLPWAFTFGSDY